MSEKPLFKPKSSSRGWMLETDAGETVTDAEGFTVWFTSRAKAASAIERVFWSDVNEWWEQGPPYDRR